MITKEDLKPIEEKLIRLQDQHIEQLKRNETNFIAQYTKGQIDTLEEILFYLKDKLYLK